MKHQKKKSIDQMLPVRTFLRKSPKTAWHCEHLTNQWRDGTQAVTYEKTSSSFCHLCVTFNPPLLFPPHPTKSIEMLRNTILLVFYLSGEWLIPRAPGFRAAGSIFRGSFLIPRQAPYSEGFLKEPPRSWRRGCTASVETLKSKPEATGRSRRVR